MCIAFAGGAGAEIAGAETELHGALGNLVGNAVRYTPAGGRIDVVVAARATTARGVFEVRDTGLGIARDHLPRLTERFYRVDGGRSRESGGTGLGLAIVKHIVQRHGGELDIDSEPGKGSTFRLVLPAARVRRRRRAPTAQRRYARVDGAVTAPAAVGAGASIDAGDLVLVGGPALAGDGLPAARRRRVRRRSSHQALAALPVAARARSTRQRP